MASLGISFLVGYAAYLFQDGEIVAHRIHGISFHVHYIVLVIVDELFSKLPKAMSFVLNCHGMNSPNVFLM